MRAKALFLASALAVPQLSYAGDVTLKSSDGTVDLTGEFIEFVNENYVIRTRLGDLRISASRVDCLGEDCPDLNEVDSDLRVAGSNVLGKGVMPLMLSSYATALGGAAKLEPTVNEGEMLAKLVADEGFGDPITTILVTASDSSDAFRSLLTESAELGLSARRIRPDEARTLRDSGAGNMIDPDQEHIVAVDSVIMIVNQMNNIEQLTFDQVRAIYSGEITNWSQVGGDDAPIEVFTRQDASGTRSVFDEGLFGEQVPAVASSVSMVNNDVEMAATINDNPNAIGFVGFAYQRGAKAISLVNDCGIVMKPDAFSARTGEYGLQRLLYIYNREGALDDTAADFLNYALSPAADEVVSKAGFIDLGIDRLPQSFESPRSKQLLEGEVDPYEGGIMREMLVTMTQYDRLSSTFRFRTGSQLLDERGRLNLERLATYLSDQPDGTEVLFAGFTDDLGPFDNNRALSVRRAEQVLEQLNELAGDTLSNVTMSATGYGPVAPTACNTSEEDRQINRRVEVWIRNPS